MKENMIPGATVQQSSGAMAIGNATSNTDSADSSGDGAFAEALAGAHTVLDQSEPSANDSARSQSDTADAASQATSNDGASSTSEVHSSEGESAETDTDTEATDTTVVEGEAGAQTPTPTQSESTTVAAPVVATATVAVPEIVTQTKLAAAEAVPTTVIATTATTVDSAAVAAASDDIISDVAPDTAHTATSQPVTTTASTTGTVETATTTETETATQVAPTVQNTEAQDSGDGQSGVKILTGSRPQTEAGPTTASSTAATDAEVDTTSADDASTKQAVARATSAATAQQSNGLVADARDERAGQVAAAQSAAADKADAEANLVKAQIQGADSSNQTRVTTATGADTSASDTDAHDLPEQASARAVQATQSAPGHGGSGPAATAPGQVKADAASASVQPSSEAPSASEAPQAASIQQPRSVEQPAATPVRTPQSTAFDMQAQQERIENIANQMATRLRLSHAAGGSQVQLQLRPRELGEVQVQLSVRDGVVAATILVDKSDTGRLLQDNLNELKRSLENQGLDIQRFDVDVRDGNAQAGWAQMADAQARNRASLQSSEDGNALAGAANANPGLSGDGDVITQEVHHDGEMSVLI